MPVILLAGTALHLCQLAHARCYQLIKKLELHLTFLLSSDSEAMLQFILRYLSFQYLLLFLFCLLTN